MAVFQIVKFLTSVLLAWLASLVGRVVYNVYLHPLKGFKGPKWGTATSWWKTYVEVVEGKSWVTVLEELHEIYGEVVRVGPNELHFSNPKAYHEIYNAANRWEKEKYLYEAFGEDHSSFGLRNFAESRERKDVLQPLFSRRAILGMQGMVWKNMNHLIEVLGNRNSEKKSSDLLFAFRCYAVDNITQFCFSKTVHALDADDFAAPIVTAMDASLPTFHVFKHLPPVRKLILSLPPNIAIAASPETAGLTNLQVILAQQVKEVMTKPEVLKETEYPTIYHRLLDASLYKKQESIPNETALIEEATTMMFAGGVTVGDTLMTGFFHLLSNPAILSKLRTEILVVWKNPQERPELEKLEGLVFLTAVIKESLRLAPGACSPLLRIVPSSGAVISGQAIPGGTIVGEAATFVHLSPDCFTKPTSFDPERWLGEGSKGLEGNLVSFSKGPRSCMGLNLAWMELYFAFSAMIRLFDLKIDEVDGVKKVDGLVWRDCFTPYYPGKHLRAWCEPLKG